MRPNALTLSLIVYLCISPAATLAEGAPAAAQAAAVHPTATTAAKAEVGTKGDAAKADAAPVKADGAAVKVDGAGSKVDAAVAKADPAAPVSEGAEALPPAAVPMPRLVRSSAAQARLGPDRPEAGADDGTTDSPEIAAEVEEESAELEDIRRAEESVKLGEPTPAVPAQPGRIALLPEIDHDLATLQAEYDIPIDVNPAVVAYVRFLQSPGVRKHFVKWLGRSYRYMDRYHQILREEGLPQDTVFLAMIESGFANFAYSRAKASGPWQFIAPTGRNYGLKQDFWIDERRDPERSAHAAARYLKRLYEQTGDWRLSWASYNAGVGRIFKAQAKGFGDFWSMAAQPGKKVLRDETKGYVPKLMAAAIITKHQEAFGFKPEEIEREAWTEYTEVEVPSATLLSVLAHAAGVSEKVLIDINPELRRSCTPPHSYMLKIPAAAAQTFAENWPAVRSKVRTTFAGHVVRRGDSLARIAALYGVPVQGILELNGMRGRKRLKPGTELLIPRPIRGGGDLQVEAVAARAQPEAEAEAPHRPEPRVRPARAQSRSAQPARSDRTLVRVRHGDTLWSLSQRYGVDVDDLCRWNRIKSPNRYKLVAGKRLVVYPERDRG